MEKPKLIVILGPTATGKSELAIKLAQKFNAEIISADSRQIYREMNIGTAKPYLFSNFSKIPHYLIDIISPQQEFNVAIYKKLALEAIKKIHKQNKLPFLVGGTAFYLKTIIDNIEFPLVAPQLKLRKELEKQSLEELFKLYKKLDPQGAQFIEKKNKRRLIRAIEVCKVSTKPFWEQRKKEEPIFNILQIGIQLELKKLKERVIKRIEKMFQLGLENEVKNLIKRYGWLPIFQTIGYKEWILMINIPLTLTNNNQFSFNKISSLSKKQILFYLNNLTNQQREKIKQDIILHTLQFIKHQITWFKKDKRIYWIKDQQEAEELIKKFISKDIS